MLQEPTSPVRESLLNAALSIAIVEGVDALSTRAVCSAAGVQAPTLYHHFGDRAGLVRAVVDRAFEHYIAQKDIGAPATSTPEQQVAASWDSHVAFARAYPGLYPAMYPLSGPQSPQMERSAALLRAGFDRLARTGALAPGITPAIADATLRAALRGVAHTVAAAPASPDNERISATVRDALISRLISPTAKDNGPHD
jgi:AcrR family transcriptional regulator